MHTSLPEFPVDEGKIKAELEGFSRRGFTGSVFAEIGLQPVGDGSFFPVISFTSCEHVNTDSTAAPDPTRPKPVQSVMAGLHSRLVIKPSAQIIEFNFKRGEISPTVKVKA